MSTRAKVEILMSGEWLYGSVNRGEFAKAIAPEAKRTFKFTRWHRRGGSSVAIIKGWLVEGWDWETAPPPAKRKAPARRRGAQSDVAVVPTPEGIARAVCIAAKPLTERQSVEVCNACSVSPPT
jgi:hypothetical protein